MSTRVIFTGVFILLMATAFAAEIPRVAELEINVDEQDVSRQNTRDIITLTIVLVAVITLYITRWISVEVTSILILPTLVFTGLLDTHKALTGFSSSATVTIAGMFILSAGLMRTGVLEFITLALGRYSKKNATRFLILMALIVPVVSAFMNNTPVVIMMVPVVLAISREFDVAPSKLLIPLSYFSIIGGSCTLIGTSTNILVHDVYQANGGPGFSMFEFAKMGVIYVAAGSLFIVLTSRKLLPDRPSLSAMLPRERSAKFVTEIMIVENSSLLGKKVSEIFEKKSPIRLLEIVRREEVTLAPRIGDMTLEANDSLIIEGTSTEIAEFLSNSNAALASVIADDERVPMRSVEFQLGEAVVLPHSPFIGRTVSNLALNKRYGAKVLAVQRRGKHHRYKIRNMVMKAGDVILIQADRGGFNALRESEAVLVVEGLEQAILNKRRSLYALGIMAGVIALAVSTPLPIAMLAVAGSALMIITKCLRLDEALRSLDASVLLLLAGTIPLGVAMQDTGMAQLVVDKTLWLMGDSSPVVKMSALFLLTSLISQVLSNNATAVLMTPIAMSAAVAMGVDAKPLLMAIAFGASASFITPIGYQTNTIVMGPGGYRFSDYMRIGVPMTIIMWALSTVMIPVLWPFN